MRLRLCAVPMLIVLLGPGRAAAQDLPPELADRFSEGVTALKAGSLDAAEAAFRDVLKAGGNRGFVHYNLGIVLQQRGRHEQALAEFRATEALAPSFAQARLLAGSSLLALGRVPEATLELKRAAQAMPAEPAVHLQLADAYERAGNAAGIVDEFRTLSALAPDNADYHYRLGKAYLKLAQSAFERIRAIDPQSARLSQALGQQYLDQDRQDQARLAFEEAAQRNPRLDEVHLALAKIYAQQGQLDRARTEIDRELMVAPASAEARALKAQLDATARPQ
jgi:tetratricopeptide (TPR) repeat protein